MVKICQFVSALLKIENGNHGAMGSSGVLFRKMSNEGKEGELKMKGVWWIKRTLDFQIMVPKYGY